MYRYSEIYEARLHDVREEFRAANNGRRYGRPGALTRLVRRISAR